MLFGSSSSLTVRQVGKTFTRHAAGLATILMSGFEFDNIRPKQANLARSESISEPQSELDVLIISQTDISCSSLGSVTVEASGGSLPYEYSLNGETAQSNGIFNDLNQGDNIIIVTDLNGCSFFVPVFIENDCIAIFFY